MDRRNIILIVDDMEVNRVILRGIFEKKYDLLEAENGEQAMLFTEQYHEHIAAMLLDLMMPVKSGYQVLQELGSQGYLAEMPVIVITAEDSAENEVQAFDLGASDIIMKPFEPHVVERRVENIIELNLHKLNQNELIEEQATRLRESNSLIIDALSSIIEYRSVETGQHIQRIRLFTKVLLEDVAASFPEFMLDEHKIHIITSAASLHDIGKIAIPDSILNKPERLTKEEFEVMKTHSLKGCEILSGLDRMSDKEYLRYAYNICRYHHERWDGSGYPDSLKGEAIPVCAQVVGIADCYDALTNNRVYKKAIAPEQAINMILNGECGAFSPKLLESCKNVRDEFIKLTVQYADKSPREDFEIPEAVLPIPKQGDTLDTLQMGQLKYFALLKYMNATVVEFDQRTGLYHVVYMSGDDFALLRSGSSLEESLDAFFRKSVYTEDKPFAEELLNGYIEHFFKEGLMQKSREYRIFHADSNSYEKYSETLIRIDTDSPHQHHALLIWKNTENRQPRVMMNSAEERFSEGRLENIIESIQICRNDKWMSMDRVSDGLQRLTGYDEIEMRDNFDNRFLNIIHPDERKDVRKQIGNQLHKGHTIETEHRILTKSGRNCWVLDKTLEIEGSGGESFFCCVLIDITKSKRIEKELRMLTERYRIVMEYTNNVVFEWDAWTDHISYSPNCKQKIGFQPISDGILERVREASHVHPEDIDDLCRMITRLKKGAPYGDIEVRIADADGRYCWYKIRAVTQKDENGSIYKAVGILSDIDMEKRKAQELEEKADQDSLTLLYNKQAARRNIEQYLEQIRTGEQAAMLLIDIDNFKQINDTYGHLFGDAVLQKSAAEFKRLFRSGDVVARIGGDEFLIFMKNIRSHAIAISRADQVIDSFRGIFRKELKESHLSCSMGIAYCPDDGGSYEELFQHSDDALYVAKRHGKNSYRIFAEIEGEEALTGIGIPVTAGTEIESEQIPEERRKYLPEQVFGILYDSMELPAGILKAMALIGKRYEVSRTFLFEYSGDKEKLSNTYEWCSDGIHSVKRELQKLDTQKVFGGQELFDEDGICFCSDITALPKQEYTTFSQYGIKSILMCMISIDGKDKGFFGISDCRIRRIWTKEQVAMLIAAVRIISAFLYRIH